MLTPLLPDIWAHWNYTHSLWPHYVALFRGHLNFSTISLLSQTTFRYSMSNKSPEQLSPLFVQKLTNVTRPFYISPDSAELANSLCLCIISYSLSLHNQILFYAFICSFHCSRAVDLWGIRWTNVTCLDRCSIYLTLFFFLIKRALQCPAIETFPAFHHPRNESVKSWTVSCAAPRQHAALDVARRGLLQFKM